MADDRRTCFAVFGCLWGPNDVSERVRLCLVVVASVLPMDLLRQDLGGGPRVQHAWVSDHL